VGAAAAVGMAPKASSLGMPCRRLHLREWHRREKGPAVSVAGPSAASATTTTSVHCLTFFISESAEINTRVAAKGTKELGRLSNWYLSVCELALICLHKTGYASKSHAKKFLLCQKLTAMQRVFVWCCLSVVRGKTWRRGRLDLGQTPNLHN
jgi:hypothetical protein